MPHHLPPFLTVWGGAKIVLLPGDLEESTPAGSDVVPFVSVPPALETTRQRGTYMGASAWRFGLVRIVNTAIGGCALASLFSKCVQSELLLSRFSYMYSATTISFIRSKHNGADPPLNSGKDVTDRKVFA